MVCCFSSKSRVRQKNIQSIYSSSGTIFPFFTAINCGSFVTPPFPSKVSSPDVSVNLLSNYSEVWVSTKNKPYRNKRHIRFWSASENFTATTWIVGGYIIMIMTGDEPHSLIEIHDAVMAHNQREIFRGYGTIFLSGFLDSFSGCVSRVRVFKIIYSKLQSFFEFYFGRPI